jgi:hypothetical protein
VSGQIAGEDHAPSRGYNVVAICVVFDFEASAFLHHMVRNLVGSLVHVGQGKHSTGMDRRVAGAVVIGAWRRRPLLLPGCISPRSAI